jgi:hypothetical protein
MGTMDEDSRERAQGMASEAWGLLEAARPREASLLFGRLLLQDPRHEEARRGLMAAQALTGELERELEALLQEAHQAALGGDLAQARLLLDDVIRRGGDRDGAHALLDRLDHREGLVAVSPPAAPAAAGAADPPAVAPLRGWRSRTAFAAACGLALVALTTTVAAGWDHLMGRLEERPLPAGYTPATQPLPAAPAGERALGEARRLLERGDVAGALTALHDVAPDDPVYPFAQQLRQRAELAARGRPDQGEHIQ